MRVSSEENTKNVQVYAVLVLIAYAEKPLSNAHANVAIELDA